MTRLRAITFLISLTTLSGMGVPALAQGAIGTLPRGEYRCELPGDANGRAGIPQPEASFVIASSSRYIAPQGGGIYLRRGQTLLLSSGARHGERYAIVGRGFLRKLDGGKPGRLRCVHARK